MATQQEAPPGVEELDSHADLSQAGAIVDKAIEYMMGRNLDPLAVASALLGGSLGLLGRSMGDEAVIRVLGNALASVQSGELSYNGNPSPAPNGGRA
ncbi:MAG: hypothetical protein ACRYHQ_31815 [Janthinobacterium lividum]